MYLVSLLAHMSHEQQATVGKSARAFAAHIVRLFVFTGLTVL